MTAFLILILAGTGMVSVPQPDMDQCLRFANSVNENTKILAMCVPGAKE